MRIQQLVVVAAILLTTVTLAEESSWGWNTKDEKLQSENAKIARRSAAEDKKESEVEEQGRYLVQEENIYSNDSSVEEVIDHILKGRREGRQLGEYDQVYADPSIQQALENGNEPMARNLIKDKLCMLGLMSCENTEEKRPFYSTIHAQGPPPPGNRINGPYYGPPRPMPPPGKYGPPPGKYGPPRKVGYEGPPISKPFYGGRPQSQSLGPVYNGPYVDSPPSGAGSISYTKPPEGSIIYGSKPPGPVFEGGDAPYDFEHVVKEKIQVADSHQNNYYTKYPGQSEHGSLISGTVPAAGISGAAGGAQVNVHHHFHHVDGADASVKAPIVSTGNGINSEFAALAASVSGGFSPSGGISQSSAFNAGFNSAGQSSLISGNAGFGSGNAGFGSANAGFGSSGSNGFGSGSNGFGSSNGYGKPSASYKPDSGLGAFGQSGGSSFGNSGFGQAQSISQSGLYQGNAGAGGYHTTNPDYYKKELQSGSSQLNSFNGGNQYGGSNQYAGNKYVSGGGDYQYETSRQQHIDCTCVAIEQCPAADRIGRKEDLILPIDPRNLAKDIEALSDESFNATNVSKSDSETAQSSEESKKSKREVASGGADEKQLTENDSQAEGRQGVNDFLNRPIPTFGIGQRKVQPTFGVSFGLPYPAGAYPTNAFGQNPAQNEHFGAISPNGLNLGLLNVNPLVSFQVSKTEYGEKVLKPLVNLHVTPNENIINKVGNLFKAKKHPVINHHDHYHHHDHYNPELHFTPHHPHINHHPEYISSGPPPSAIGHTGPSHFYHGHESFAGHSGPGPSHIHHGPPDFYPSSGPGHLESFNPPTGPSYPFTGPGFDQGHYPGGGPFQRSYNLSNDQNLYTNSPVKFNDNAVVNNYAGGYNEYLNNDRRGKQLHLIGESDRIAPTQVPGNANGGDHVSFPKDRRRRSLNDDQIEKNINLNGNGKASVMSSSVKLTKRQSYYGPRPVQPQQCRNHEVCCRSPLRPPPQQQQLGRCGTRNANGITGRIKNPVYVDGDSEFGEYPWHVGILKKDPKESVYVCGGTLIDQQHIITAAHCIKNYKGFDLRVRLGEWDVNHDVEFFPYIERDVVSVHIHPEYYAGTLDNDLAVLKLDHPVDFTKNPHISPACMPDKFSDFTGARCWTTGWGKDAFGDYGKYQNILKEVDVPIIGQQQCQNQLRQTRLGYNYKLNPGFLCAGGEEGKDACKGDGGGPLVCDRNGAWHVVGVVSWGIGCGQTNVPGVYVRVSHYLDWINQITRSY